MPSKNIVKQYEANQYYHIYSRGSNKQTIFREEKDYLFYLSLFKRYLSSEATKSQRHGTYPNFSKDIELLAYCLMPNHVHILLYQHSERSITELMRSIMTSYSKYYNLKYKHFGPLFQSRYLASIITHDSYLHHISRYIHLNPREWRNYPYSSVRYFLDIAPPDWLKTTKILELFDNSTKEYEIFLKDYEEQKQVLEELKWELANVSN